MESISDPGRMPFSPDDKTRPGHICPPHIYGGLRLAIVPIGYGVDSFVVPGEADPTRPLPGYSVQLQIAFALRLGAHATSQRNALTPTSVRRCP
jgi:hypothetical protein